MNRAAFKVAVTRPVNEIAAELQELLGQQRVAFAAGVSSQKLVGRWAAGRHHPREAQERRLRELYRTVLILRPHYPAEAIRAFLFSDNPDLQGRTPMDVIHDGQGAAVIHAADTFVEE